MEILHITTLSGLLLISGLMLASFLPRQSAPGWFSAAFCSALLILCHSVSALVVQLLQVDLAAEWLQQLAMYAAPPLLAFVWLALSVNIDWPKEAWGRILLGVCGIYWLAQQGQVLEYLLPAAFILAAIAKLKQGVTMSSLPIAILILLASAVLLSLPATGVQQPALALFAFLLASQLQLQQRAKSIA